MSELLAIVCLMERVWEKVFSGSEEVRSEIEGTDCII